MFKDIINKRAEEAISTNPAVQSAYAMCTKDIVASTLNTSGASRDWFMSLNHMSYNDGVALLLKQPIQNGFSFAVKDTGGVSRDPRIHVNPKWASTNVIGDGSGKTAIGINSTITADLIYSGTNNMNPTISGIQQMEKITPDHTQNSQGTVAQQHDASDNPPNANPVSPGDPSFIGPVATPLPSTFSSNQQYGIRKALSGKILQPMKDPSGKIIKDTTQRTVMATNARTGTIAISPSELSSLANSITAGIF